MRTLSALCAALLLIVGSEARGYRRSEEAGVEASTEAPESDWYYYGSGSGVGDSEWYYYYYGSEEGQGDEMPDENECNLWNQGCDLLSSLVKECNEDCGGTIEEYFSDWCDATETIQDCYDNIYCDYIDWWCPAKEESKADQIKKLFLKLTSKVHSMKKGPKAELMKKGPKTDMMKKGPKADTKKGPKADLMKKGPKAELMKKGPKAELMKKGPKTDLMKKGPKADLMKKGPKAEQMKKMAEDTQKKNMIMQLKKFLEQ